MASSGGVGLRCAQRARATCIRYCGYVKYEGFEDLRESLT